MSSILSIISPKMVNVTERGAKNISYILGFLCSNSYMTKGRYQDPEYMAHYRIAAKDSINIRKSHYQSQNREYFRLIRVAWQNKLRSSLIQILGSVCVRCGIDDVRVLQFDHIFGGGVAEIKNLGGSWMMYAYYRDNPDVAKLKLQLLCANCHVLKTRGVSI